MPFERQVHLNWEWGRSWAIQKAGQKFPYAVRKTCTAGSQSQKAGKAPYSTNAEFRRGEWTRSLKMESLNERKSLALPLLSNLFSLMRLYQWKTPFQINFCSANIYELPVGQKQARPNQATFQLWHINKSQLYILAIPLPTSAPFPTAAISLNDGSQRRVSNRVPLEEVQVGEGQGSSSCWCDHVTVGLNMHTTRNLYILEVCGIFNCNFDQLLKPVEQLVFYLGWNPPNSLKTVLQWPKSFPTSLPARMNAQNRILIEINNYYRIC